MTASTLDHFVPPEPAVPSAVKDFYRELWRLSVDAGGTTPEFLTLKYLVTHPGLDELWKWLKDQTTESSELNDICISLGFCSYYWQIRRERPALEDSVEKLRQAAVALPDLAVRLDSVTLLRLGFSKDPRLSLETLASYLKAELAEADKYGVQRLTKHAERNLYIRSLATVFEQEFGKPHYSRIAEIVSAVTGDAVDGNEVRKIVQLDKKHVDN